MSAPTSSRARSGIRFLIRGRTSERSLHLRRQLRSLLAICLLGAVLAACEDGTQLSPTPLPPVASPTAVADLPATMPPPTTVPVAPTPTSVALTPTSPALTPTDVPVAPSPTSAGPTLAL